jgi:hypothetical protein
MQIHRNMYRYLRYTNYCICSIEIPTRCAWIYMYSLFPYIFALYVSGTICTHPQEHKLQSTALGVCEQVIFLVINRLSEMPCVNVHSEKQNPPIP